MDVSKQVDSIVENLVKDIETRLSARVDEVITKHLEKKLGNFDYDKTLNYLASVKLDSIIAGMEINKGSIQNRLDEVADTVLSTIRSESSRIALENIRNRLATVDVNNEVRSLVANEIGRRLDTMHFPNYSIPGKAIQPANLVLSGDNITGGIVKNFSSTGIEDRSTQVQMTILDAGVVIENRLVTQGLEVEGGFILNGNFVLNGEVPKHSTFYTSIIDTAVEGVRDSMNEEFFSKYAGVIFDSIREHGLDLNRITLNGTEVVTGNKLNYGIVDTNITRLGLVKDLQTTGETVLSESLYVGKNKVGIGTLDPTNSLSVWDQEVELGAGKRQKDVGWFGTPRRQDLVISANGQDNITLTADGDVRVQRLTIKNISITTASSTPNTDMPRGTVAFNENPALGQPIGWVSLGGGAWTRFGTIG